MANKTIKQTSKATDKSINANAGKTEAIEFSEVFYKDKFSWYLILIVLFSFLLVFMGIINLYVAAIEPTSKYIFVDSKDRVFSSYPLDNAIYSDAEVMDWSAQAVIKLFDFNFLNLANQIKSAKGLFIDKGFDQAVVMLKTEFIPKIFSRRYIVKANLCDVAELSSKGLEDLDGQPRYSWQVVLPVNFKFARDNTVTSENQIAKIILKVKRVSDLTYLGGLAISDIDIQDLTVIERVRNYAALPVCQNG